MTARDKLKEIAEEHAEKEAEIALREYGWTKQLCQPCEGRGHIIENIWIAGVSFPRQGMRLCNSCDGCGYHWVQIPKEGKIEAQLPQ